MKIKLGREYSDAVTGFTGTATARTTTLHRNTSVLLERADNEGRPEEVWLPELRLRPAGPPKKVGLR